MKSAKSALNVNRHLLPLLVLAVGLLSSCKPTVPSQYIQPDEMEDLLVDFHLAQSMARENDSEEAERDFRQTLYFAAVLEKHDVTKAQFDSSLVYYYIRADRFSDIYKNVAKRLSEEALVMGATDGEVNRFSHLTSSSDTIDVWRGRLSAMLLPYPPYNRMDFTQQADTSFRKGDSFLFMVNADYIYQSGSHNARVCLVMRYDNDTVISRAMTISTSGINQLRVPELKDRKVKEISGFIHLQPEKESSTTLKLMAVKNIRLIKFRTKQNDTDTDKPKKDGAEQTEAGEPEELQQEPVKTKPLKLKNDNLKPKML